MKKALIIIVSILVVIVLVAGYFGFVPGISQAMGANKAKDLGIKFTQEDLDKARQIANIDLQDLSEGNTSLGFSGQQEITGDYTSEMITAMIYPIILSCFGFAVMIFFTTYVIPKIGVQILKTGQQLPAVTRFVLGVSDILTSWKWDLAIVGGLFVFIVVLRRLIKTKRGTYIKDRMLLSLPIFGKLLKQRIVARFASTFSILLSSGLVMADSLRVVSEVTGNVVMSDAVKEARDRILTGSDIATPLRDSGVIGPTVAHMIAVGEKSGELEKMLKEAREKGGL